MKDQADTLAWVFEKLDKAREAERSASQTTSEDRISDALAQLYKARDEPVSFDHHESPEQQILKYVLRAIAILENTVSVPF